MALCSRHILLVSCILYAVALEGGSPTLTEFGKAMASSKGAEEPPQHTLQCTPYIRANNSDTKFGIAGYLNNSHLVPCNKTVSSKLKAIFEVGEEAEKKRTALQDKLGNLCSSFVDVISVLAIELTHIPTICADNVSALSTDFIENQDFCTREDLVVQESGGENPVWNNLQVIGLISVAEQFDELLTLYREEECSKKCGDGDGRVLCNSFYSLAVLLSQKYQKREEKSPSDSPPSDPPPSDPPLSDPPPSDPPPSDPPPSDSPPSDPPVYTVDSQEDITKLLPLLALPAEDLLLLSYPPAKEIPHAISQLKSSHADFPEEVLKTIQTLSHPHTTLRMFWLVKSIYDMLAKIDWKFYSDHVDALMHIPDLPEDVKRHDFGDELQAIIDGIAENIDILQKDSQGSEATPTQPSIKTAPPTTKAGVSGKKVITKTDPPKGNPGEHLEDQHSPKPPPPPPPKPPPEEVNAPITRNLTDAEMNTLREAVDFMPVMIAMDKGAEREDLASFSFFDKWEDELNIPDLYELLKQYLADPSFRKGIELDEIELVGSGQVNLDSIPPAVTEESPIEEIAPPLNLDPALQGPVPEQPPGAQNQENQESLGGGTEGENAARSYGPFHFLGLFLVIAVVVVVTYLCMHNRKKLREGVNGYVSGAGKRRRARQYKPLPTTET